MSPHELKLFRSVYTELQHNGLQEVLFGVVFRGYQQLCVAEGIKALGVDQVLALVQDGIE